MRYNTGRLLRNSDAAISHSSKIVDYAASKDKFMAIQPLFTQIEKTIQTNDGNIVLENHTGFPYNESNLYLITPGGNVVWKAEKPDLRSLYTRIKLNEDFTLSTFTTDGMFCELDLRTGKIISKSSFK